MGAIQCCEFVAFGVSFVDGSNGKGGKLFVNRMLAGINGGKRYKTRKCSTFWEGDCFNVRVA